MIEQDKGGGQKIGLFPVPKTSMLGSHGALAREVCVKPQRARQEHREACPKGMKLESFILPFPRQGTDGRCPAYRVLLALVTRR